MEINRTIFRLYDIRGSSLLDINTTIAYKIGFCFTKLSISKQGNKILIGRDGRLSSPALYHALVNGIISAGGQAISIGVAPSPMLYFADKIFKPQASIMITGSHNPKDDNGFKMLSQGKSFFDQQIQHLLNSILNTDWSNMPDKFIASSIVKELDITAQYIDRILQEITIEPKIKVAWDPANGAAGNITELLALGLPNKNIVINSEIDGNFPNHHPDPTIAKNLEQLIEVVKTQDCDIGIAFDGDADRIAIISKKGRIILGDQILCILAKDIIDQNPQATIIMDIKSSSAIFNQIKSYGGRPIMWKTGHSFIKDKMQTTKALLGGETSGHIFFADKYYGYDDAIYAALRFLDLLSRSEKTLDDMIDELPKCYSTPEISIPVPDDLKFDIIQQIKEDLISQNIAFNDIDGIRIDLPIDSNAWWLLRASNTEAKIIARYESDSLEGMNIIKSELSSLLAKYGLKLG
ncbi:phosphomannomutase/phosphoglucomutase [Candidatus Tisiphia endosymbiont of Ptychoptera albimana]|uniref:phosphomannomutase/phosphoglucomutase n=1 Tax=Candidatus Tisiphia endosymbiont of Ptychoptera albimana TaxID=3066260 RepID=UPI001DB5AFB0|nr:phosphomannomutase/phosphoglucomutase [Rickettsia endosymbiont of Sericostoma sp. HW-2014]